MKQSWIFLRGLARGNGHWGDFPEKFKIALPEAELEMLEIPGNGTRHAEITPTDPILVINEIKKKSLILKKQEPIHLCGISLGGMVALKWASLYPGEISSLVLINTSLSQCSSFYQRLKPKCYFKIIKILLCFNPSHREKLILSMVSNNQVRASIFENVFTEYSKSHPISFKNLVRQIYLANQIQLDLPIMVPTKIITSQCDNLVNSVCSVSLAKANKTKVSIHPTAGHDLPLDDPEWLIEILSENK